MYPKLIIDLAKIRLNTEAVVRAAGHIAVHGVTKGCAGSVAVAGAMRGGGAAGLADSRLSHLIELRRHFPTTPLLALRQPMRHEAAAMVELDAAVIISDIGAAEALSAAADKAARAQDVLVMIEVGDRRDGVAPEAFFAFVDALRALPAMRLCGIAANVGCRGGHAPSLETMRILTELCTEAGRRDLVINTVSAGNSSCWNLLKTGRIPFCANQMRFGEAILLGLETIEGRPIPELRQDACRVEVEVLQASVKATGAQAITAIGCQDVGAGALYPLDDRLTVTRLTSDHCVITVEGGLNVKSGDIIPFRPSYFALQALAASAYVEKEYMGYNVGGMRDC